MREGSQETPEGRGKATQPAHRVMSKRGAVRGVVQASEGD